MIRASKGAAPARDLLESAEELYQDAPCGYLTLGLDGRILQVNRTFLAWTGYDIDEVLGGMRFQDLLTPGGRVYLETHLMPLLSLQGSVAEIALDLRCAGTERRLPVLVNATQKRDGTGAPVLHRITVVDATDRRRYERELLAARTRAEEAGEALQRTNQELRETGEALQRTNQELRETGEALQRTNQELATTAEALRQLNGELEERVARAVEERLRAEEQLRQSQKMEALGQLSGSVAHDFNNLLGIMVANLEVAEARTTDAVARRLIGSALRGADRAAGLIRRMLAFARRQNLEPQAVPLDILVTGMTDLLTRSLGPGVALDIAVPSNLPPALVDPNQLEVALINLAVNARHAMPEGGTFRVAAATAVVLPGEAGGLPPGLYLRLTASDTGAGMDEATLARAAEPFFTTKPAGEGTGLGLSMVHGLAAQSGGRLEIRSRPGEGTCVEMWLQAALSDSEG